MIINEGSCANVASTTLVNDHVSLQWPSYGQPHGSNLRPQREQTSWSQALTTGYFSLS